MSCPSRLAHHKLLQLLTLLTVGFSLLCFSFPYGASAATLLAPSDYIADDTPGAPGVTHNVGFVVPLSGHTIVATDYIRITLTNYTAVTAPTSGNGWSGVPTYGVLGSIAYVTGVTASPGNGIFVGGITATNPALP